VKAQVKIGVLPRVSGVGGMVSFHGRFVQGLQRRGIQVEQDLPDASCQAVLLIGGTRQLGLLLRLRRQRVRLVQRLDGLNWLHRRLGWRQSGWRHALRAESANVLLRLARRIVDRVVYQSEFVRGWWERWYGPQRAPGRVIHNGVDLQEFSPFGPAERPAAGWRILLVEGSLGGGYEQGLEAAVYLAHQLALLNPQGVELQVAGRVAPAARALWEQRFAAETAGAPARLNWAGLVPQAAIPALDRSADLLYSADIQHACPNSVIEALACGLPVLAFDTGALPELVTPAAGRIVPYGGDPWKLDPPDLPALVPAALEILTQPERFRSGARQRAEEAFDLEKMLDAYLEVLLG